MNQQKMRAAIEAMDESVNFILANVKPGTPGKLDMVYELTEASKRLVYELPNDNNKEETQ